METKKSKRTNYFRSVYYAGTLASLLFLMMQGFLARQAIVRSSEWEKAKMTIENIERFKERISISPLSKDEIWRLGDDIWADASTPKGWELTDTLRIVFSALFDNNTDASNEIIRLIDLLNTFAYPIIMGYASEFGSYQSAVFQYYAYASFIMPWAFHYFQNLGVHAKLLYRLWRLRTEIMIIDNILGYEGDFDYVQNVLMEREAHLLYFEGTDFSEASLRRYRRVLDRKLREMQREIRVFRRNSLR